MFIGSGYILVLDIICQQLGKYSDIGYILPTIGRYIFWYQIYSANNWGICSGIGYFLPTIMGIYSDIGYILPTIVEYMSIMGCLCPLRAQGCRLCIFQNVYLLKKAYSATLHPPIDIYPPIVGRIYSIPIYKFKKHVFPIVGRIYPILIYKFN